MKETLRGTLLSVLFFGFVALLAVPLPAQGPGEVVPAQPDGELFELRRSVLDVAEDAYTRGDAGTLQRMEAAPIEQTMAEVAEKLFRELGAEMSRAAPSGLAKVESAAGWWACFREYLSSMHSCWMAYNNCMQPRGNRPPNESWCKVLLDACMDAAAQRYDQCREGPLPI